MDREEGLKISLAFCQPGGVAVYPSKRPSLDLRSVRVRPAHRTPERPRWGRLMAPWHYRSFPRPVRHGCAQCRHASGGLDCATRLRS